MPKDPRHSLSEGRHIAWRAAWDTAGRRYWRWILFSRFLPPIAIAVGIAVPVVVAWQTVDRTTLAVAVISAGALAMGVGFAVAMSMSSVRARMRGRSRMWPGWLMFLGLAMIFVGAWSLSW